MSEAEPAWRPAPSAAGSSHCRRGGLDTGLATTSPRSRGSGPTPRSKSFSPQGHAHKAPWGPVTPPSVHTQEVFAGLLLKHAEPGASAHQLHRTPDVGAGETSLPGFSLQVLQHRKPPQEAGGADAQRRGQGSDRCPEGMARGTWPDSLAGPSPQEQDQRPQGAWLCPTVPGAPLRPGTRLCRPHLILNFPPPALLRNGLLLL